MSYRGRCTKCGLTNPAVHLYRFPKPGVTNVHKCKLWTKYCFPESEWSSREFQSDLYNQHKMLCHKHFKPTSFKDFELRMLHKNAVPDAEWEKMAMAVDEPSTPSRPDSTEGMDEIFLDVTDLTQDDDLSVPESVQLVSNEELSTAPANSTGENTKGAFWNITDCDNDDSIPPPAPLQQVPNEALATAPTNSTGENTKGAFWKITNFDKYSIIPLPAPPQPVSTEALSTESPNSTGENTKGAFWNITEFNKDSIIPLPAPLQPVSNAALSTAQPNSTENNTKLLWDITDFDNEDSTSPPPLQPASTAALSTAQPNSTADNTKLLWDITDFDNEDTMSPPPLQQISHEELSKALQNSTEDNNTQATLWNITDFDNEDSISLPAHLLPVSNKALKTSLPNSTAENTRAMWNTDFDNEDSISLPAHLLNFQLPENSVDYQMCQSPFNFMGPSTAEPYSIRDQQPIQAPENSVTNFQRCPTPPLFMDFITDVPYKKCVIINPFDTCKTMATLCSEPIPATDKDFFDRIIKIIDKYYPEDWRTWKVADPSYEDVIGDSLTHHKDVKFRFALPTVDLAQALTPNKPYLSEKKYKCIKRKLLQSSLGRALLYAPKRFPEKIHEKSSTQFLNTVEELKPKLLSRKQAMTVLRRDKHFKKRPNISVINKKTYLNPNEGKQSKIASTHVLDNAIEDSLSSRSDMDDESSMDSSSEESHDFTIEFKDPKLSKTYDEIAEEGSKLQKFGDKDWSDIPYTESEEKLQAYPVFNALKVNVLLNANNPAILDQEETDLTLGTITHGLLLQKKAFKDTCKDLDPDIQKIINEKFLATESPFTKISEDLINYTCGRRSEVIKARRELHIPNNKVLRNKLEVVPPSETHLFCEEKLAEVVREFEVFELFPKRARTKYTNYIRKPIKYLYTNKKKGV